MALTYVGGNSNTGTGATIAVSLTALTGGSNSSPSAGDLVVVFFGLGASGNWTTTLSEQSGNYTHFGTQSRGNDTRDAVCRGAYRIQPGTPDTSVTVSGPNNTAYSGWAAVQVWRGVNSATPLTGTASGTAGIDSNHADAAAITPGANNAVVIFGFSGTAAAGTADSKTLPTGYTTYAINTISTIGSGAECYYGVAAKLLSGGSGVSEDPGALSGGTTSTSDGWATWTAALNPAPASQTCTEVSTLGDVLTVKLTSRTVKETLTLTDTIRIPSKTLTEVIGISHATMKLAGIILMEGLALTDPTVVTEKVTAGNNYTVTPPPTELATLSDTLRVVKGSQQLTETLVLGGTLRVIPTSEQLTESATLTATGRIVKASQQATESVVLTSTPQKGVGRQVVEAATLADTLRVVAQTKQLTEGLILSDPIVTTEKISGGTAYTLTPPPTETAVLADTVRAVLRTKQLTESAALVDTLTKGTGKVRTETATLADVVTKGEGRALAEIATLTATPTKGEGRAVAEVVALVDAVRAPKGTQQLSAAAVLADTVRAQKAVQQLSELVGLTDLTVETQKTSGGGTAYTKNLTETAVLVDTLRAVAGTKQLTESVVLADTVRSRAGTKQANELVTLTATPTKDVGKVRTETVTLTATPTKGTGKQVTTQVATLTDTLRAQAGTKQATETVVLDASPTKATTRTLTEGLALTDPTVITQKGGVGSSYSVNLTEDVVLSGGYLHVTALVITEELGLSSELAANRVIILPPITVKESLYLTDVVESRVVGRGLSKSQNVQLRDTVSIVYTTRLTARTEVVGLVDVLDITGVGKILTEQLSLGAAVLAPDTYATESSLVFAG